MTRLPPGVSAALPPVTSGGLGSPGPSTTLQLGSPGPSTTLPCWQFPSCTTLLLAICQAFCQHDPNKWAWTGLGSQDSYCQCTTLHCLKHNKAGGRHGVFRLLLQFVTFCQVGLLSILHLWQLAKLFVDSYNLQHSGKLPC